MEHLRTVNRVFIGNSAFPAEFCSPLQNSCLFKVGYKQKRDTIKSILFDLKHHLFTLFA